MANEIQYLSQNGSGLSVRAALIDPEAGATCGYIWDGSALVDIASLAGTAWRITLANKSSTSLYYGDRPSGIAVSKRLIVLVWESATPAITDQFDGSGELSVSAADLVDLIWDEVLTGATHNVASSAGRRLRQLDAAVIHSGTAQAGAANSITLDTGASATNDIYDENLITIVAGTGTGQTRIIAEYNGSTKVAIVDRVWTTTPDSTSEFVMIGNAIAISVNHGLAQAGAAGTITLASDASSVDDIYNGSTIVLRTSTGSGQSRLITDYNGTTKVATVAPNWVTNPTSASVYVILPVGRSDVQMIEGVDATDQIADAMLDRTDGIESGVTLRLTLRRMAAIVAGKVSGAGSGTETFVGLDGTTTRVVATVDASGNRSAMTYS